MKYVESEDEMIEEKDNSADTSGATTSDAPNNCRKQKSQAWGFFFVELAVAHRWFFSV